MKNGNETAMICKKVLFIFLVSIVLPSSLTAQSHPDLGTMADFPMEDRVWLAAALGEISINPSIKLESKILGKIEWRAKTGEIVSEDQVICLADSKKLELSSSEVTLKQDKYPNSTKDIHDSNQEKKKALRTSIIAFEAKIAEMTLTVTESKLLGQNFAKRLIKERADIQKELTASQSKLDSNYFEIGVQNEIRALDLELEKAQHENQELRRISEIRAPTLGRLSILSDDVVKPDSIIGEITKDGIAEARIELNDLRLRNVVAEELAIELTGDDGRVYRGTYLKTLQEQSVARNARIVVFTIDPASKDQAIPEDLRGIRMLQIKRLLKKPGRIVPKSHLIFKFPEEISKIGWASFIEKRWDGSKVVYVGPRELAILGPDEH